MAPAPAAGTPRDRGLGGGCGIVLAVIVVLVVGGFLTLDRGVDWLVERAGERIRGELPAALDGARRAQVEARLQRFLLELPRCEERDRLTGEFLGRVGAVLDDRRVTVDEAEDLDRWLAQVLGERGDEPSPGSPQ